MSNRLLAYLNPKSLTMHYIFYLQKPFDIMVSETFDAALIGEKFLPILIHAKSSGLLTHDAVIIPNSAIIHAQLMESTFSLPLGSTQHGLSFHASKEMFNLEPMRRFRHAGGYTVRYLNEANAVRAKLSPVYPMFRYDFQNYNLSKAELDYSCIIFEISKSGEDESRLVDTIGLWFSLNLDADKELVLTNSPESPSCWMQSLYRLSKDVIVKRGDFLRIQVVQLVDTYVFAEVGHGKYNEDSRLVKFSSVNCPNDVEVYSVNENQSVEVDGNGESKENGGDIDEELTFLGTISPSPSNGGASFKVLPGHVNQLFKLITLKPLPTNTKTSSKGKSERKLLGMYFQLQDSTAGESGSRRARARRKIALDEYTITCPTIT